jgi:DNA-binding SARP family transcriptional activator
MSRRSQHQQPRGPTGRIASEASSTPEAIRIKLLGGFRVWVGPRVIEEALWRLRKSKSLVKLLALSPGHRLHREQVMDALWPGLGMQDASNNLRQTLHVARRTLEPDRAANARYLSVQEKQLTLCPRGHLWVDVEVFEEAAATARRARDPATYRLAIELYAGELLPGDRYEEWAEGRREELRQLYLRLLIELAGICEGRDEHEAAVEALRRVATEDPTREEAHAGLMRLYVLSDRRTQALVQYEQLRKALSEKLGTEPSASTHHLYEEIAVGRFPPREPSAPAVEEPLDAGKHNLPASRSSFVGREAELRDVKRDLAMTRLLTLTGAGGCGKTRLALEVARELVEAYSDGVWLVELAPLSEGVLVAQAVAAALGVQEQPDRSLTDTLADFLRAKRTLLVLDNCEHLIDAVASLVDALLNGSLHLRVLATSRESLNVEGELNWLVPSLSVPSLGQSPTVGELTGYESVRLFAERARHRNPAFSHARECTRRGKDLRTVGGDTAGHRAGHGQGRVICGADRSATGRLLEAVDHRQSYRLIPAANAEGDAGLELRTTKRVRAEAIRTAISIRGRLDTGGCRSPGILWQHRGTSHSGPPR